MPSMSLGFVVLLPFKVPRYAEKARSWSIWGAATDQDLQIAGWIGISNENGDDEGLEVYCNRFSEIFGTSVATVSRVLKAGAWLEWTEWFGGTAGQNWGYVQAKLGIMKAGVWVDAGN